MKSTKKAPQAYGLQGFIGDIKEVTASFISNEKGNRPSLILPLFPSRNNRLHLHLSLCTAYLKGNYETQYA